ncbi:MAG TPA: long-chain fatty acid--CoA ligase [Candidatus Binataceae bacterium]|nr:long-chain fatty acid--CoA ligase [Candidatus Binataceae bacterium]
MAIAADTLAKVCEREALRYVDRAFLTDKRQHAWRDHSWRYIAAQAMRLRTGLTHLGIEHGDRVAILSENSPEWVIMDLAVLGLGAVVVPLYTTSGAEETRHVITDSGARLIAVNGNQLIEKVQGLGPLPGVEGILAMHPDAEAHDGANLEVITVKQVSDFEPLRAIDGSRSDLATLIYTSGTTGPSKGVMLTHGNILANCESNIEALNLRDTDIVLSVLPIAHAFERTGGYYTVMAAGGTIAYAEGLGQIAENLLEIEPTVLLTVPRMLEAVYSRIMRTVESSSRFKRRLFAAAVKTGARAAEYRQSGVAVPALLAARMALYRRLVFTKIQEVFGSRLRYLISGGAPLPLEINRFLAAAELPVVEGYGLTEAAPVVSCNLHGRTRMGTVGRPLKNIELRLNPDGELLVRGPNVMAGYYNHEEETREVIDREGWLHTGDIAEIDADGYIKITDRKKEIIVLSSGKNISPANLESRLVADPLIAQVCVIGDRRKHLAAIIVPDFEALRGPQAAQLEFDGAKPEEAVANPKVRKFFHDRLRDFNRAQSDVEAIVDFTLTATPFSQENGELTPTLKVRRKVVQEHYRSAIDAMYGD